MNNGELKESYDPIVFHHKYLGHYVYPQSELSESSINVSLPSDYQTLSQIYNLIDSELVWSEDKLAQENMAENCDENESSYNYYFSEWLIDNQLTGKEMNYLLLQEKAKKYYSKFIFESAKNRGLFDGLEDFNKSIYKVFIKSFVSIVAHGSSVIDDAGIEEMLHLICSYLEEAENLKSDIDVISIEMKFKYCGGSDELFGQTIEFIEELQDILAWPDDYTGWDEA